MAKRKTDVTKEVTKTDPHPLVVVTWEDASSGDPGWIEMDDVDKGMPKIFIETSGYLAKRTDEAVYVSMNKTPETLSEKPNGSPFMRIPIGCVVSVEEIALSEA